MRRRSGNLVAEQLVCMLHRSHTCCALSLALVRSVGGNVEEFVGLLFVVAVVVAADAWVPELKPVCRLLNILFCVPSFIPFIINF